MNSALLLLLMVRGGSGGAGGWKVVWPLPPSPLRLRVGTIDGQRLVVTACCWWQWRWWWWWLGFFWKIFCLFVVFLLVLFSRMVTNQKTFPVPHTTRNVSLSTVQMSAYTIQPLPIKCTYITLSYLPCQTQPLSLLMINWDLWTLGNAVFPPLFLPDKTKTIPRECKQMWSLLSGIFVSRREAK